MRRSQIPDDWMPSSNKNEAAARRRRLANAVRALSMDAVQAANSGHPGAPMGMADIAEVLWNDFLKHNPGNPRWWDRDRFVLSNGHGSMLLYALLHLTGYPLPIDQLRNFRQLGAHTAGHPERELEIGIETTTGPLGQGVTNAVGMAIAERHLAATFNRPGFDIIDHHTWVFLGDGCLMEGISHEACSLAGTLGLGKLICLYDDNGISIDGDVSGWFTDDTAARFRAYGWHVIDGVDGHDPDAIAKAIRSARSETGKPSLIACRTVIGFGAPNLQGTAATHGAPLGDEEIAAARKTLGWDAAPFEVPEDVAGAWDATAAGARAESEWNQRFASYAKQHPELAAELTRRMDGDLPDGWRRLVERAIADTVDEAATMATRKASLGALNRVAGALPELLGGSADLTGSNCTKHAGSTALSADDPGGNYIYFGVREFAMTAIGNGLALHGGVLPYSGTFLTFSDYARNAVRMAALMRCQNILVYTHDSIGLGEDGPTHQPVEHTASLRLIPNLTVWRPADTTETLVAWVDAIERRDGPTALVLTRQNLTFVERDAATVDAIRRGGYVLREPDGIAIEAGVTAGWWRYVGERGDVIGLDRYGESAPAAALFEKFGFTVDAVTARARQLLDA